ncbi:hypothetical protein K7I13_03830 [Brucepastera parasyntrophica]|uniref:hypothetical protein n=1 Tax=Brucepastera parasyntrophica TaxID=2880008 RepID=UPI0021086095|nr:hypothetical protein [Brucepastera parasyntrophica]ULQ60449.1 hypothetical protein K7I13_03830 [Brucepastera parasyntrophica]
MAIHLGFHWHSLVRFAAAKLKPGKAAVIAARIAAACVAVYGIYASAVREMGTNLFARNVFSFWDYDKPPVLFFLDFLAILGLYVFITYYGLRLMEKIRRDRQKNVNKI